MANGVEYYTFGNSDFVYDMLSAVAMMMGGNSGYESLVRATMLLAFMGLLVYGVFKQSMMPVTSWFFAAMLAWYGLFIPKVNVIIVDESNPTYTRVVSNMPLGLAYMGNFTSSIGRWFTQKTEAVFSPIAESRYSETGMVFGTYAYTNLRSLTMIDDDPGLQTDWTQFLENCTRYDTTMYAKASGFTVDEALKSPDLLTLLGKTNVVLPTNVSGTTMYCNEAYANLFGRTKSLTQNTIVKRYAKVLNSSIGTQGQSSAAIEAKRLTQAGVAFNDIFNGVRASALETVEQQVMINMVNFASVQGPQITNDLEKMQTAIAASTAQAQMIASENTAFLMASKYLPIIHNVLEGLIIALFPLVLVVMVLAGIDSFSVVVGYMSMLMSIKLWPGLFAIINGIASTKFIYGATAQASSTGLTLSNADTLFSMAHSSQAFSGGMALLVPVIAHFIVSKMKGGLGWAASLAQGVKGTAEKSGAGMGTGDFSLGNASWNTARGNKFDLSSSHTDPNMAVQQTAGMTKTSTLAPGGSLDSKTGATVGGTVGDSIFQANQNSLPVGMKGDTTRAQQLSNEASAAQTKGNQWAAEASKQTASGTQQLASLMANNSDIISSSDAWTSGMSASDKASWQKLESIANKATEGMSRDAATSIKNEAFAQASLGASLGSGGPGVSAGGEIGTRNTTGHSETSKATAAKIVEAAKQQGVSFSQDFAKNLTQSQGFQQALASGDTYAQGASASFSKAQQATQSARQSYAEEQRLSSAARDSLASSFGATNNYEQFLGKAATQLQNEGQIQGTSNGGFSDADNNKIIQRAVGLASQAGQPDFSGTPLGKSGGGGSFNENPAASQLLTNGMNPGAEKAAIQSQYQTDAGGVQRNANANLKGVSDNAGDLSSGENTKNIDARGVALSNEVSAGVAGTKKAISDKTVEGQIGASNIVGNKDLNLGIEPGHSNERGVNQIGGGVNAVQMSNMNTIDTKQDPKAGASSIIANAEPSEKPQHRKVKAPLRMRR